jgi:1-aminocyclopropane-1-carboxylate deaminase/D-cysteine desulfhydrase-like pyridoxal-dependent ACC family enzyme
MTEEVACSSARDNGEEQKLARCAVYRAVHIGASNRACIGSMKCTECIATQSQIHIRQVDCICSAIVGSICTACLVALRLEFKTLMVPVLKA